MPIQQPAPHLPSSYLLAQAAFSAAGSSRITERVTWRVPQS